MYISKPAPPPFRPQPLPGSILDTDYPQRMMLRTNIPDHVRKSLSEEVISVIHAPQSFQNWVLVTMGSKQLVNQG